MSGRLAGQFWRRDPGVGVKGNTGSLQIGDSGLGVLYLMSLTNSPGGT